MPKLDKPTSELEDCVFTCDTFTLKREQDKD